MKIVNDFSLSAVPSLGADLRRLAKQEAPSFPMETLGPVWHSWASQNATTFCCSPACLAVPLLAAAAMMIGNARWVSPWVGRSEPPALWMATVLGYGRNSNDVRHAANPLLRFLREYAASSPRMQVMIGDACRIRDINFAQDKGSAAYAVDLDKWQQDAYVSHPLEGACWRDAYHGRLLTVTVNGANPIAIPYLTASINGYIRHDKLPAFGETCPSEMWDRFLWQWPIQTGFAHESQCIRPTFEPAHTIALKRLLDMDLLTDRDGKRSPVVCRLTSNAMGQVQKWQWAATAAGVDAQVQDVALSHVVRLALVLEFLWWCAVPYKIEPTTVSEQATLAALALFQQYFKPMGEHVRWAASLPESVHQAAILAKWIAARQRKNISLSVNVPGLRSPEAVRAAATSLMEAGWLASPRYNYYRGRQLYSVNREKLCAFNW